MEEMLIMAKMLRRAPHILLLDTSSTSATTNSDLEAIQWTCYTLTVLYPFLFWS